jgi:2-aminoethylphosphonate-pyruvate transaminase
MKKAERKILLNPGPATTTDTVKYAQIVSDICPREAEFGQLIESIAHDLTRLVGPLEKYATILFAGSGTAAVEAILSSVIGEQDHLLIVQNGAYGKRMCEIAAVHQLPYLSFESSPVAKIDLTELENVIRTAHPPITHLAMVHHETTTGLLNDIATVGALCQRYGIEFIIDAMSSYGALPIQMEQQHVCYLAASSNKNLQGMAGVSFVIADRDALKKLRHRKAKSYYFDLLAQYEYFQKNRQFRFTPPVQTLYALRQAMDELQAEGVHGRYQRYSRSWQTLVQGLQQLRLQMLLPIELQSKIVTTVLEPKVSGYQFQELHDYLYKRGFTIYPGKLHSHDTFRISTMGAIDEKDIKQFLQVFAAYIKPLVRGGDKHGSRI